MFKGKSSSLTLPKRSEITTIDRQAVASVIGRDLLTVVAQRFEFAGRIGPRELNTSELSVFGLMIRDGPGISISFPAVSKCSPAIAQAEALFIATWRSSIIRCTYALRAMSPSWAWVTSTPTAFMTPYSSLTVPPAPSTSSRSAAMSLPCSSTERCLLCRRRRGIKIDGAQCTQH